jgi:hypothetical protein
MKKPEEIVSCVLGCNGTKDLCIPLIADRCMQGKRIFVMYGAHIEEKLREIGSFKFEYTYQNGIKIGMWIEKGDLQ